MQEERIPFSQNEKIIKNILSNKVVRIILALLFFLFIYKIIYNILVFFSIDENFVKMYMAWIGVFILLITILPYERYAFTIKKLI
jgi:hypothetical protein